MASAGTIVGRRVSRYQAWDALFVALSLTQAAVLVTAPSIPVIALGLWWNANTVAHNFLHRPFFRSRALNRGYSIFLSVVLGVPQSVWRDRHLAHHVGRPWRPRLDTGIALDTGAVIALWTALAWSAPAFVLSTYLPGWIIGLALCQLHGHYEHARGTTSHYGKIYNTLFFNDGYHVEHHARPGRHWSELAADPELDEGESSRWPPVLRWIETVSLENLERVVLRSRVLQGFVVRAHERALRRLEPSIADAKRVLVVGGGLFPRTALVVRRVLPEAEIEIVDAVADHLEVARPFLDARVSFACATFDAAVRSSADLVILPLAFIGDRARAYADPPAARVLIHDWIWVRSRACRSSGSTRQSSIAGGVVVSWWLLKRLNLVVR
jgi:hypothetical protein